VVSVVFANERNANCGGYPRAVANRTASCSILKGDNAWIKCPFKFCFLPLSPSLSPLYNLSVLPSSGANLALSAPAPMTPVAIAIALGLTILFFLSFTLISFHDSMHPKVSAFFARPRVQQVSTWIGFFGFFVGITAFLVLRMWFGKAVDDFNASIEAQGSSAAQLAASTGNAFTMIWVAYAFYGVPLVISMAKHNVKVAPK